MAKLPSWYTSFSAEVVPEMTAVSNPNNKPPSAAINALASRYVVPRMDGPLFTLELGWDRSRAE